MDNEPNAPIYGAKEEKNTKFNKRHDALNYSAQRQSVIPPSRCNKINSNVE